jgi:hypothetical protein
MAEELPLRTLYGTLPLIQSTDITAREEKSCSGSLCSWCESRSSLAADSNYTIFTNRKNPQAIIPTAKASTESRENCSNSHTAPNQSSTPRLPKCSSMQYQHPSPPPSQEAPPKRARSARANKHQTAFQQRISYRIATRQKSPASVLKHAADARCLRFCMALSLRQGDGHGQGHGDSACACRNGALLTLCRMMIQCPCSISRVCGWGDRQTDG